MLCSLMPDDESGDDKLMLSLRRLLGLFGEDQHRIPWNAIVASTPPKSMFIHLLFYMLQCKHTFQIHVYTLLTVFSILNLFLFFLLRHSTRLLNRQAARRPSDVPEIVCSLPLTHFLSRHII